LISKFGSLTLICKIRIRGKRMPYKENYIKINLAFQIDNLELYFILEYKFTTIIEFKLGFKTKKRKENRNNIKEKGRKLTWAADQQFGPNRMPPARTNCHAGPTHQVPSRSLLSPPACSDLWTLAVSWNQSLVRARG
jgi:hypothetical protein